MNDNILSGMEDVPKIANNLCADCGNLLTEETFSGWFRFVKKDGQMYQVPICKDCDKKSGELLIGTKVEE